jgi:hypothetical protein
MAPQEYFPDHPKYQEWVSNNPWEMVWPEWKLDGKYGEGSLVTFNGRYYVGTSRFIIDYTREPNEPFSRQLPNGPPDTLVDEDNVRAWAIRNSVLTFQTYSLNPYKLVGGPYDEDESTQEFEGAPYVVFRNPFYNWKNGVRSPELSEGASFTVYQGRKADPELEVPYEPPTSASECGAAFQTLQISGIGHGVTIASINGVWSYYGDRTESPDYNFWQDPETGEVIPPFDQNWNPEDNDCSVVARGTPGTISTNKDNSVGQIYYAHNHPLYFKRSVSVKAGYFWLKTYWKFFPQTIKWETQPGYSNPDGTTNPAPCFWYWGGYLSSTEGIEYGVKNGTFSPKEDCWAFASVQPPKVNSIGTFTLPVGDDLSSGPASNFGLGIKDLEVTIESN